MYEFGIFWFLALLTLKAGDLVNLWAVRNRPLETLVLLAAGVGAAEALQWNLFGAYAQDITAAWLGVVGTGLVIGAAAGLLRTVSLFAHAIMHRVDGDIIEFDFERGQHRVA